MRSPIRRVVALIGLTTGVVISGSIAAADGPSAGDITAAALASNPAALDVDTIGLESVTATSVDDLEADVASSAVRRARTPALNRQADLLAEQPGWTGRASWYGPGFHGRTTANGETYDQDAMTAAHKTLPFGTRLRVTNVSNGRTVTVRINDRGPFIAGREIDLSRGAARVLGIHGVSTVLLQEL